MSKNDDLLKSKRDGRYKNPEIFGMTFSEKSRYYQRKSRHRKKIKAVENKELTTNEIVRHVREASKSGVDVELKILLLKKGGGYCSFA